MYRVAGRSAATTAVANRALAGFWNPHTTIRCRTAEIHICTNGAPAAGASLLLKRTSARGTSTSTVTPTIENDIQRAQAPTSGAVLDLTFSAEPTIVTMPAIWQWTFAAVAASAVILPIEETIPPGTGLVLANVGGIIFPISDITVVWREEF
jgi:methylmalonyl-CoA mutase N-terminal domain/subunit